MTLRNVETMPHTASETLPAMRLWCAVVRCAANDLFSLGAECKRALAWFFDFADGPGSFLWCCEVFDLDPEAVRKAINEGKVQKSWVRMAGREETPDEDPDEEV